MKTFTWDNNFITGIDDIDRQHRALVETINEIAQSLTYNSISPEHTEKIIQKLLVYTVEHFNTEEQLMLDFAIDHRHQSEHRLAHKIFTNQVKTFYSSMDRTHMKSYQNLLFFLMEWLSYHILGADQRLSEQISTIKNGDSPKQAYQKCGNINANATGPLLKALNNIIELLRQRNEELATINHTLEEKVNLRTAELERSNKELDTLSRTDTLTELFNRRHALKELERLWSSSCYPLSILLIDVDHFKSINDQHGHDCGDIVLTQIGVILKTSTRDADVVCRIGGDEFFIICPHTPIDHAITVAQRICTGISTLTCDFTGSSWQGSASIGVACQTGNISDITALLKQSDESLYMAKADGRNCVRAKFASL